MESHPIILFDGVCNLCNASVQFIIERDKKNIFKFASLQSNFGQNILKENGLNPKDFDSFILFENNKIYQKSTAALRVAKRLPFAWNMLYVFIVIPAFLRNVIYNFIAKNRYKWFGKKESCWMPTPDLKAKFIE